MFLRVFSLFLCLTLGLEPIAFAVDGSVSAPAKKVVLGLEIPTDFVSLKESYQGTNGKLIVHLQDAHANLSGQQNIAKMLDFIFRAPAHQSPEHPSKPIPIFVEGASRDVTLARLKEALPKEDWKHIASRFLHDGVIAGEEYLNLTTNHPMQIIGVEDRSLYLKNLQTYAELKNHRQKALDCIHRIQISVNKLKIRMYPKEVLRLERLKAQGREDKPFYYRLLKGISNKKELESADFSKLLQDLEHSKEFFYDSRLTTHPSRLLRKIDQYLDLLEKALRIELSSEEFQKLKQNLSSFDTDSWQAFLNKKLSEFDLYGDFIPYEPILDEVAPKLLEFYEVVDKRDEAFVGKINRLLDDGLWMVDNREERIKNGRSQFREIKNLPAGTFVSGNGLQDNPTLSKAGAVWVNQPIPKSGDVGPSKYRRGSRESWEGGKQTISSNSQRITSRNAGDYRDSLSTEIFVGQRQASSSSRSFFFGKTNQQLNQLSQDLNPRHTFFPPSIIHYPQSAFLIAGGYHTQHLTELLKKEGYSYVVLTPKITSQTNIEKYERLLLSSVPGQAQKLPAFTPFSQASRMLNIPKLLEEGGMSRIEGVYGKNIPFIWDNIAFKREISEEILFDENRSYLNLNSSARKGNASSLSSNNRNNLLASKSEEDFSPRNLDIEDFSPSKFLGGIRTRMTPWLEVVGTWEIKSVSWVMRVLVSEMASVKTFPLETPLGESLASWPRESRNDKSPWWTFSSSRKRIFFEEFRVKLAFFENLGRIVKSGFNVLSAQRGVSLGDFIVRSALLEHLKNQINHNSRPFKTGFSVTNFRPHRDVLFNLSHFLIPLSFYQRSYHTFTLLSRPQVFLPALNPAQNATFASSRVTRESREGMAIRTTSESVLTSVSTADSRSSTASSLPGKGATTSTTNLNSFLKSSIKAPTSFAVNCFSDLVMGWILSFNQGVSTSLAREITTDSINKILGKDKLYVDQGLTERKLSAVAGARMSARMSEDADERKSWWQKIRSYIDHLLGHPQIAMEKKKVRREVIAALMKALRDGNEKARLFAVKGLIKIGEDVIPDLINALKDLKGEDFEYDGEYGYFPTDNLEYRYYIFQTLNEIDPEGKRTLPALIKALNDKNEDISVSAARSLKGIGGENISQDLISDLIVAFNSQNGEIRSAAEHIFYRMGPQAKAAIPVLIKAFEELKEVHRPGFDTLLAQIGEPVVPALIEVLLSTKNRDVHYKITNIFRNIGPQAKTAVPVLIKALEGRNQTIDDFTRLGYSEALVGIGAPAVPALFESLKSEESGIFIREALEAIVVKIGIKEHTHSLITTLEDASREYANKKELSDHFATISYILAQIESLNEDDRIAIIKFLFTHPSYDPHKLKVIFDFCFNPETQKSRGSVRGLDLRFFVPFMINLVDSETTTVVPEADIFFKLLTSTRIHQSRFLKDKVKVRADLLDANSSAETIELFRRGLRLLDKKYKIESLSGKKAPSVVLELADLLDLFNDLNKIGEAGKDNPLAKDSLLEWKQRLRALLWKITDSEDFDKELYASLEKAALQFRLFYKSKAASILTDFLSSSSDEEKDLLKKVIVQYGFNLPINQDNKTLFDSLIDFLQSNKSYPEVISVMRQAVMKEMETRTFSEWRYQSPDYQRLFEEHGKFQEKEKVSREAIKSVQDLIKKVWEANQYYSFKSPEQQTLYFGFTDNFSTLLNLGNPSGFKSCQACYKPEYNRGLSGTVSNGWNKALVIFDEQGKFLARRIVRLRLTDKGELVLLREPTYGQSVYNPAFEELLSSLAHAMNIRYEADKGENLETISFFLWKGHAQWEYSDVYGKQFQEAVGLVRIQDEQELKAKLTIPLVFSSISQMPTEYQPVEEAVFKQIADRTQSDSTQKPENLQTSIPRNPWVEVKGEGLYYRGSPVGFLSHEELKKRPLSQVSDIPAYGPYNEFYLDPLEKKLYAVAGARMAEEDVVVGRRNIGKGLPRFGLKEKILQSMRYFRDKYLRLWRVPRLIRLLTETDMRGYPLFDYSSVCHAYVKALGEIGPQAKEAIPLLMRMLGDELTPSSFRNDVVQALIKIGDETIPFLIEASRSADWPLRRYAIKILGEIDTAESKEIVSTLIEAMEDGDFLVRSYSMEALCKIGPKARASVFALVKFIRSSDFDGVVKGHLKVFEKIDPRLKNAMRVVELLEKGASSLLEQIEDQNRSLDVLLQLTYWYDNHKDQLEALLDLVRSSRSFRNGFSFDSIDSMVNQILQGFVVKFANGFKSLLQISNLYQEIYASFRNFAVNPSIDLSLRMKISDDYAELVTMNNLLKKKISDGPFEETFGKELKTCLDEVNELLEKIQLPNQTISQQRTLGNKIQDRFQSLRKSFLEFYLYREITPKEAELLKDPKVLKQITTILSIVVTLTFEEKEEMRALARQSMDSLFKNYDPAYQEEALSKARQKLNEFILTQGKNPQVLEGLKKSAYDQKLWEEGVWLQILSSEGITLEQKLKEILQSSFEIVEIAISAGIENIDNQPLTLEYSTKLDSHEASKVFYEKIQETQKLSEEKKDRIKYILDHIQQVENKKIEAVEPHTFTATIKKDFLNEATAGLGVPGCFHPKGIHREMPLVHAFEANSFFIQIFSEDQRQVGNAVIVLGSEGAYVYSAYDSSSHNLSSIYAQALHELSKYVPQIILTPSSAGYPILKDYATSKTTSLDFLKPSTVFKDQYFDYGKADAEGNLKLQVESYFSITKQALENSDFKEKHSPKSLPKESQTQEKSLVWQKLVDLLKENNLKEYYSVIGPLKAKVQAEGKQVIDDNFYQIFNQLVNEKLKINKTTKETDPVGDLFVDFLEKQDWPVEILTVEGARLAISQERSLAENAVKRLILEKPIDRFTFSLEAKTGYIKPTIEKQGKDYLVSDSLGGGFIVTEEDLRSLKKEISEKSLKSSKEPDLDSLRESRQMRESLTRLGRGLAILFRQAKTDVRIIVASDLAGEDLGEIETFFQKNRARFGKVSFETRARGEGIEILEELKKSGVTVGILLDPQAAEHDSALLDKLKTGELSVTPLKKPGPHQTLDLFNAVVANVITQRAKKFDLDKNRYVFSQELGPNSRLVQYFQGIYDPTLTSQDARSLVIPDFQDPLSQTRLIRRWIDFQIKPMEILKKIQEWKRNALETLTKA
jgi:HEAT repeat protein